MTAQMASRRSGRYIYTNTNPCLQDRTDGKLPVREIYTYTQIQIPAYMTAQMASRRSGRYSVHIHKYKSLPTRPYRWQVAGQGDTYTNTNPRLHDRTDGKSPVREIHVHTHKYKSLPTRLHRWQVAGQGDTRTNFTYTFTHMYIHAQYMNLQQQDNIDNRSMFRQMIVSSREAIPGCIFPEWPQTRLKRVDPQEKDT